MLNFQGCLICDPGFERALMDGGNLCSTVGSVLSRLEKVIV